MGSVGQAVSVLARFPFDLGFADISSAAERNHLCKGYVIRTVLCGGTLSKERPYSDSGAPQLHTTSQKIARRRDRFAPP
jgi:hypothetical protein